MKVDLGELMRERSSPAETAARGDRVAEVRRRIGQARRRRAAGAVVASCALIAAVAFGAALLPRSAVPEPEPVATMRTIDGFPEYQAGARVIGTAAAQLPETEVSVTVVSNLDLVFTIRCDTPMWIEVRVAGRDEFVGSSCGPDGSSSWRLQNSPELLASYGAAPGEPVTFTASVTDGARPGGGVDLPVPEHGSFALAVMQRVPFDEYPFPPRPETLPSIEDQIPPDAAFELRSDPLDPDRPASRSLAWSADLQLEIFSTTPGFVHLSINGARVSTHENWGYDLAGTAVRLGDEGLPQFAPGTIVLVTADPEHVTGAWAIWSMPTGPGSD